MNVLILTTHLNPGGVSRYVVNIAKGLKNQGNEVLVASGNGEWGDKLKIENIKHNILPLKTKSIVSPKLFFAFLKLRKLIVKNHIEILHCNSRITQFLGFLVYKYLKIPYVSVFHGYYNPKISRMALKCSGNMSITVSKAVRNHAVNDLGIDKNQIRVVYNGIDYKDFPKKEAKRENFGFNKKDHLIGILGRISQEKGHFLAIDALKILKKKYRNIYLLISGKGKKENELKNLIAECGLNDNVKFMNLDSNTFLEIIDLLIVPSKKEGFGYSIIEAFYKEIPVVAHAVGGISEIIRNRKNGLLFHQESPIALADTMEEILLKPELRKKIIQNAKDDSLYFSMRRMALDTEKVYREII